MSLFRRAIRFFLITTGLAGGIAVTIAAYIARILVNPSRNSLWTVPTDWGIDYEDVQFPARDGLRLSGWFLPQKTHAEPAKTVIFVHGLHWNRLGTEADDFYDRVINSSPVELMRLTQDMHRKGYNVLLFDLRNHGNSAADQPVTLGIREAIDVLGALDYVQARGDVSADKVGVIGFSMGANAILYALAQTDEIAAAVAVQPASPSLFAERMAQDLAGRFGKLIMPLTEFFYRASGGIAFKGAEPLFVASSASTPVLYIQAEGDKWGAVTNVQRIAEATPISGEPIIVDEDDRFAGYQFPLNNPEVVTEFFDQLL